MLRPQEGVKDSYLWIPAALFITINRVVGLLTEYSVGGKGGGVNLVYG